MTASGREIIPSFSPIRAQPACCIGDHSRLTDADIRSKETLLQALLLCRPSGRISFADALVWAAAIETEDKIVYSLDARFPHDGIEIRRNGA